MVLVFLSTVVAAIGLIENNVAVVIGAMVIAPLLGPNLAFGLGTALGDIAADVEIDSTPPRRGHRSGHRCCLSLIGMGLAVRILASPELLARTQVGHGFRCRWRWHRVRRLRFP